MPLASPFYPYMVLADDRNLVKAAGGQTPAVNKSLSTGLAEASSQASTATCISTFRSACTSLRAHGRKTNFVALLQEHLLAERTLHVPPHSLDEVLGCSSGTQPSCCYLSCHSYFLPSSGQMLGDAAFVKVIPRLELCLPCSAPFCHFESLAFCEYRHSCRLHSHVLSGIYSLQSERPACMGLGIVRSDFPESKLGIISLAPNTAKGKWLKDELSLSECHIPRHI
jgi:hypothetical protein